MEKWHSNDVSCTEQRQCARGQCSRGKDCARPGWHDYSELASLFMLYVPSQTNMPSLASVCSAAATAALAILSTRTGGSSTNLINSGILSMLHRALTSADDKTNSTKEP
eukprot:scaffold3171_cov380-Prasinococcus_capsulatus_cf.AAC.6